MIINVKNFNNIILITLAATDGLHEVFAFPATVIAVAATCLSGSTNGALAFSEGQALVGLLEDRVVIAVRVAVRLVDGSSRRLRIGTCLMMQNDYTY